MARNTESDGTYCSEVEKEDRNQIRRSKRLSQRSLLSSFRLNGDPIQRLYEIYQMLKYGKICSKWSIDNWESLKFEVESIKQTLNGKQKGRISFILKKINQNLQKSSSICPNESPSIIQPSQNDEQVKSPNILAGMMTEVLTEIPPYQPENLPKIINTVKNSEPSIVLTQKNPLDLTKKILGVQVVADEVLSQDISEKQKHHAAKIRTQVRAVPFEQKAQVKRLTATTDLCISKDSMIDLTEENAPETNRENIVPIMKGQTSRPKSTVHVSKWLQFLPTQQRPTYTEKPASVTTSTIAPRKNSKTLKDSIVKLYKDQPTTTTGISNKIQKPLSTSCPKKSKHIQKSNSSSIRSNEKLGKIPFRNTENITTRDPIIPSMVSPRNVQSEPFGNISPDFVLDEFLELSESDMNDSVTSLTPSLKEDFRKVFGTDKLKDVFVGDEVIYNLKENHVRCLATALKVEHATLKKTIENILSNDNNYGLFQDDVMQSDSSVVECSQSPPQRLFPSQRSQS